MGLEDGKKDAKWKMGNKRYEIENGKMKNRRWGMGSSIKREETEDGNMKRWRRRMGRDDVI